MKKLQKYLIVIRVHYSIVTATAIHHCRWRLCTLQFNHRLCLFPTPTLHAGFDALAIIPSLSLSLSLYLIHTFSIHSLSLGHSLSVCQRRLKLRISMNILCVSTVFVSNVWRTSTEPCSNKAQVASQKHHIYGSLQHNVRENNTIGGSSTIVNTCVCCMTKSLIWLSRKHKPVDVRCLLVLQCCIYSRNASMWTRRSVTTMLKMQVTFVALTTLDLYHSCY